MKSIDQIKNEISLLNVGEPIFKEIDLTYDQQFNERAKPRKYLESTIELLKSIDGTCIVELGCMRELLRHPLSVSDLNCCGDGHSTYFWGTTGQNVYSVDIDWKAVFKARWACRKFRNVKISIDDGINFLKNINHSIDLLYLDAWDVISNTDYAEKHLEAYEIAKEKLSQVNIISIDDTDIAEGGKGRLLIPRLLEDGYEILVSGRQTIAFMKNNTFSC